MDIKNILHKHKLYLSGDEGGQCANFNGSHMSGVNLRGVNLEGAGFRGTNLWNSSLRDANLHGADLRGTSLRGTNMRFTDLGDARLNNADLSNADLLGANLLFADLSGAILINVIGNGLQIKTLILETYHIAYTRKVIQIGCENHKIRDWFNFDDAAILRMDGEKALNFWRKWKGTIRNIIEMSPAK
jgi:hypothetical protein